MKKFALVRFLALLCLLCCFVLAFSACSNNSGNDGHVHSYTVKVVAEENKVSPATCKEKAKYYYFCDCGEKGSTTFEFGDLLEHKFENYVSNNDATYESDGTKTAMCEYGCGTNDTVIDENTKLEPEHVHEYDKQNAIDEYLCTKATCQRKATYYYTCSCGEKSLNVFETGDVSEHLFKNYIYNNDATYESDGTKTAICVYGCGETDTVIDEGSKLIPGHTHVFDKEITDKIYINEEATCEKSATYYYSCECGRKGEQTFEHGDVLGHDFGDWQTNKNGTHTRVCKNDIEHKETDNCLGGKATCVKLAQCETCNGEYGVYGEHLIDIEKEIVVTCTENGYIPCGNKGCDYKEITDIAEGHDFLHILELRKASCTQEQTLRKICDICGEDEIVKGDKDFNNHVKYDYVLNPSTGLYDYTETQDITIHPQSEIEYAMGACPSKTCNLCEKDLVAHENMIKRVVSNGSVICEVEQIYVDICLDCKAYIGEMEYHEPIGHKYVYKNENGYVEGCAKFEINLICIECGDVSTVEAVYNNDKTIENGCDTYIYSYEYSNGEKPEILIAEIKKEQDTAQKLPLEIDCGGGGTHILKVGDMLVTGVENNMTLSSDNVTMPIWKEGLVNDIVRCVASTSGTCLQTIAAVFDCADCKSPYGFPNPIVVNLPGECELNYSSKVVTHATCSEIGTTKYKCTVCNKMTTTEVTTALGHDYEWKLIKETIVAGAGADAIYQTGIVNAVCKNNNEHIITTTLLVEEEWATCCKNGKLIIEYRYKNQLVYTENVIIPSDSTEHVLQPKKIATYIDWQENIVYEYVWCYTGERFVLRDKVELVESACSNSTNHNITEIYNKDGVRVVICQEENKAFIYNE